LRTYITITDDSGTKKYEYGPNFRRNLKFAIITIIVILGILIFGLAKLKAQNSNLKNLAKNLYTDNVTLINEKIAMAQNAAKDRALKLENFINESNDEQIEEAFKSSDLRENEQKVDMSKVAKVDIKARLLKNIPNLYPIQNRGITDNFGMRIHPISKAKKMHDGIDLRASIGTPVVATADGVVEYATKSSTGYGYLVILSHNFGFKTRYAHLQNIDVVRVGQFVKKGDLIGYSGNTGYSTGPHLHYEVRFLERSLDPINFMKWHANNFDHVFQTERKVPWQALTNAISEY